MKNKALASMSWYSFDLLLNRGSYFLITIYIAKIIGPGEFGLASILGVIYYLGLSISDSGMSNSLMRTRECDDEDYGTVLLTNLLFGAFVYAILLIGSPFISDFYKAPKLTFLLPIYGLGIIFSSVKSVYIAFMMKNFDYKKMFLLNMPGNLISIIIAVALSNYGYGIWSVVLLFLSNQFISLVLFLLFSGWSTKFILNRDKFRFHFKFGYKLSISAFINTIFENIYQLIIGRYYSIRMTGIYDRAFTLGNYPISILSTVISKVTLPLFVNYGNDQNLFREKFRESIKLVSFLTCLLTSVIFIVVPFMIEKFMGAEWVDSIKIFQILCLGLLFYPIHSMNLNILNVFGRSDIFLWLEILKKIVQVISILLCYKFGIIGLVLGFVGVSVFSLFINLFYTQRFLKYSIQKQLFDIFPNLIVSVFCLFILNYIFKSTTITTLVITIQVILFSVMYYLLSFFSNKVSFVYIKNIITGLIKKNNNLYI